MPALPAWLAMASTMPGTLSTTPSGAWKSLVSIRGYPRRTLTTARLIGALGHLEAHGVDAECRVNHD